jgi:hypothetical protein
MEKARRSNHCAGRGHDNYKSAKKGSFTMFCNSCNNGWLWLIIILILLFAAGGTGLGCGCGCENNNGCGCGCN